MRVITAEQLKTLETRKAELEKLIEELCKRIIADHDILAEKIRETKNEMIHFESVGANGAEFDIYNVQSILEAGKNGSVEEYKRNLKLLYKAYSTNPFSDRKNAEEILELLEEYGQVVEGIDLCYKEEFLKAQEEAKKAQSKLAQARKKRKEHRESVLFVKKELEETMRNNVFDPNELRKNGAEKNTSGWLLGCANSSLEGVEIVGICKSAVSHELKQAEDKRKVISRPKDRIVTDSQVQIMDGEPIGFFSKFADAFKF